MFFIRVLGTIKNKILKFLKYIIPFLILASCNTSNTDSEKEKKTVEIMLQENVTAENNNFVPLEKTSPIKIIIPGEHLGYKMETFDSNNQAVSTNIRQNEKWIAIYADSSNFYARIEKLTWDSTKNFTISSDTAIQPVFYVQGLDNILQNGSGTKFSWQDFNSQTPLKWTFLESKLTVLNSLDPNCKKIANYKYGTINSEEELTIFKVHDEKLLDSLHVSEENTIRLFWTGDLNGDKEPDFFIGLNTHHEEAKIELILSNKSNDMTEWKRLARFHLWS